jgi:hypothetical protein
MARELVRDVLEEQGWSTGEGPVHRELRGSVSLRLVREVLRELKAERRSRWETEAKNRRTSIQVKARDAVWAQDATHLAWDEQGRSVQAEVVREVASTRTLDVVVGLPAAAADVIRVLERVREERGTLPLVLVTDNGPAYVSHELDAYLARHRVVHLFSLPRTPQHNPCAEHGMRELKDEADLEGVQDIANLQRVLLAARDRLDGHRLRRTRAWRTAVQADAEAVPAEGVVCRARFYAATRCAIAEAVLDSRTEREHRRATREAVLQCLQRFGLISRTRAGEELPLAISYTVS